MTPLLLKRFLLLENPWIHTSFILDIDLQLLLQNTHLFKILFLFKKPLQLKHIEEQVFQLISKFLSKKSYSNAFLNKVKEYNLALENPKYSPNALEELGQYIHNFEKDDIERVVTTQTNPHHWLQADIKRIQSFIYHYYKRYNIKRTNNTSNKTDILISPKIFPIQLSTIMVRTRSTCFCSIS